jgi:hypothetical protein
MLTGFADQIGDPDDEAEFRSLIRRVPFFRSGGTSVEKCNHGDVENIAVELGLMSLLKEFSERWMEFMCDADLASLEGPITSENINQYMASVTPAISDENLESN